jgi:beta-glucuronidase
MNVLNRSRFGLFCLLASQTAWLVGGHCLAKTFPLITNVDHRETTSLNGEWKVIIDPYEYGFYDYRYKESPNGFFKDAKPSKKSDLIEYSFDDSGTLTVPGDWNSQDERLFLYEGTVWYRKTFDYDLQNGNRLFAYFGAANYQAFVYLNGTKLGTHTGGFTPFCFEITDLVRPTGNSLIVKVDNTRIQDAVPTVMSDWWNYGGLTRRVLVIEQPETFIRDYLLQLKKGDSQTVAGWVQLNGPQKKQEVKIEIPEVEISTTVQTNKEGYAEVEFPAELDLWSPENPKLYQVLISSPTDAVRDKIGFRSIETQGTDILLNGKPIFLRGICMHEEAPLRPGRANSQEDARQLLEWAGELNCNFVRLAHYPHNEYMTRMADEMGFLVWSEIPLYWTISWHSKEVYENAIQQLTEMISRDKNKASVILWSVANETPVSEQRTNFLRDLIKVARSQDSTRLLTAALQHISQDGRIRIDDPLGQYLDVLGCNEYIGWYGSIDPKGFEQTWDDTHGKPLIMSEFGGGALQGFHADEQTRWSEEFQSQVYQRQIPMLKEISFLRGTSPWILKDFRSPRRPLPGIQDYFNRKGLISDQGKKKQAFYILQQFYHQIEKEGSD